MPRQRTQYVIGGAVLALHAGVCWLLLSKMRVLVVPDVAQSLELLWLPPPPPRSLAPDETQIQKRRASRPAQRSAPPQPTAVPEQNPAPPENNAITSSIDWQAELAREAAAAAAAKPEPRFKDFGFPRRAPPVAKAPQFAWDRNHTRRVESGGGALVVHLSDNCAFVMTPLPFVFCTPGKRPANGDLFEHMKDSPAGASGGAQ